MSIARREKEPEVAARRLTETAFTQGSADNITCIVVRFHHDKGPANDDQKGAKANPADDQHKDKLNKADGEHSGKAGPGASL